MRHAPRLLVAALALGIALSCGAIAFGANIGLSATEALSCASRHVESEAWGNLSHWAGSCLGQAVPLYDVDGSVTAWGFDVLLENRAIGYVIVDASPGEGVIEFGDGCGLPWLAEVAKAMEAARVFGGVEGVRMLYPAALSYPVELSVHSPRGVERLFWYRSEFTDATDVLALKPRPDFTSPPTQSDVATILSEAYVSGVPDYGWYRGCAPTAAGNALGYWHYSGFPNLPTSNLLIDELAAAMGTDSSGWTYWVNVAPGILQVVSYHGYTGWRSWNDGLGRTYSTFTEFQAEINVGRPIVVYTSGSSTYGDHFVTGVGWRIDTKNWVVVHDTWPETPTNVYVDYNSSEMGTPGWTYVVPLAL